MSELCSARSYFLARDLHRNRARKRIQEVRPTATGPDHWHCGHDTWATVVGHLARHSFNLERQRRWRGAVEPAARQVGPAGARGEGHTRSRNVNT